MFIALSVSVSIIGSLRDVVATLRTRDPDLADQLRRAASSVALNIAEGAKRAGRDQLHFYRIASGSVAEVRAALLVADAWGHLEGVELSATRELLDRQAALLYRLLHRRA